MKECTDQELVEKLIHGENSALNELMARYKQRVFAFIWRYVGDEDVAYDLVQETFTRLYFGAKSYKPEYTFSTWLFQIALNLCRDYGRKQKMAHFISIDSAPTALDLTDNESGPESTAQTAQVTRHLRHAIESLPHNLKTALILFSLEERTQEECATLLGTTAKTIETRVYRARKLLEEKLFRYR